MLGLGGRGLEKQERAFSLIQVNISLLSDFKHFKESQGCKKTLKILAKNQHNK